MPHASTGACTTERRGGRETAVWRRGRRRGRLKIKVMRQTRRKVTPASSRAAPRTPGLSLAPPASDSVDRISFERDRSRRPISGGHLVAMNLEAILIRPLSEKYITSWNTMQNLQKEQQKNQKAAATSTIEKQRALSAPLVQYGTLSKDPPSPQRPTCRLAGRRPLLASTLSLACKRTFRYPITSQETVNALVIPLGLLLSMGGDDHVFSDGLPARLLLEYAIKIKTDGAPAGRRSKNGSGAANPGGPSSVYEP
ncbi:hypothetical protein EVAR_83237_1 [Eumeta japonica]|uniref:Uncharacterized protein n=1 Tax=Eumeta variegata TaxID=151549 RepID=A0A4C1Y5T7_EUMVA|nr:hypothetical protein EVAR_83237_1 [Eumeta japonica]